MKYTSSQAAKLLRTLNDEYNTLIGKEGQRCSFIVSLGEDPESVRPVYDYLSVQEELCELERKIRVVKHAINQFNVTTVVPELELTIDQVLIYIPQLSSKKRKLEGMMRKLPKQRYKDSYRTSNIVEYEYANYDIEQAEKDYREVTEKLNKAQTALDVVNNTKTMEINL